MTPIRSRVAIIQFRFATPAVDSIMQSSHANCQFSAVSEFYFLVPPLKLFPSPPRCPIAENVWNCLPVQVKTVALLSLPTITSDWEVNPPTFKNQRIVRLGDVTLNWQMGSPTATGQVRVLVHVHDWGWLFAREYRVILPTTDVMWTPPLPQWAPSKPLKPIPLSSFVWTPNAPRIYREPSVSAMKRGSVIYSAQLTGEPSLELPIASFQARVNNSNYSYLSVVVPNIVEYLEEIEARLDGYLIVKRGYRWSDGTKQLDELIRTKFDNLRYDMGTKNSSGTLTGYYAAVQTSDRPRHLTGISYINVSLGKRRYRCDVDTFLRPGGEALAQGFNFIVGEISYSISSTSATMEVTEA